MENTHQEYLKSRELLLERLAQFRERASRDCADKESREFLMQRRQILYQEISELTSSIREIERYLKFTQLP